VGFSFNNVCVVNAAMTQQSVYKDKRYSKASEVSKVAYDMSPQTYRGDIS